MRCCLGVVLFGLAVSIAARSDAADSAQVQAQVKKSLAREIVGPVLPMAEVQRFCDARIPRMPKVDSVSQWQAEADRMRAEVLEKIVYRGESARWRDAPVKVEWLETMSGGPGYRIKKLRYEALPGLWIPALLYEPEKLSGKVPAVLNVNGHVGGPGKAYVPKQLRCINQAKRGMLALNVEWVGMGQLGGDGFMHYRMNQIDLCGSSGLAVHYLNMKRGLDVLLAHPHCDPNRVAMTGLSGGGWQTIFFSSLDTRIKLTNPVAGYSSFVTRTYHLSDLGDSEQTPNDLATVADYAHLTAMMAPRPTLLTKNAKDNCCFASGHALQPLLDAAGPVFRLYGKEGSLRSHVNQDPGTHNYEVDNRQAFYRMVGDFFYSGDKGYNPHEIPSDKEVKTPEDLAVKLPEKNEDFHTLAMTLCKELPRDAKLPEDKTAGTGWRQQRQAKLREIVKAADYQVHAIEFDREEKEGVKAVAWKLQMAGQWTVPAVELVRGEPKKTAILVADAGRTSAAAEAARLLDAGYRVLAVDPFYFGESKIAKLDFLFGLLVAAVGERPLGIQASQVAAVARWSAARTKDSPVTLVAVGPRSSVFVLVAAALEEKAVAGVELHGSLGSLKEVIEQNWAVNEKPELFCFGLLESFDLAGIAALAAPRPVVFAAPSDRVKKETAPLAAWYRRLGSEFDPCRAGAP
jgi:dienelactone hydrolase